MNLSGMVVDSLDSLCSPPTPATNEFLDFDWVTAETMGLIRLTMMIMQFLEGAYDADSEVDNSQFKPFARYLLWW